MLRNHPVRLHRRAYRIHPKAIRARRNRRLLVVALLVLLASIGYLDLLVDARPVLGPDR